MSRDLLAPPDPAPGGSFALAKLYADCVAPSGEVAIVYAGHVARGRLGISLSGVSFFDRDDTASESWALSRGDASIEGHELRWSHGDSSLIARSSANRFRETLFESEAGSVAFDCLVPDGTVTITGGARILEGRGYAERLDLTIPPWALAIDTLRWGRFASEEERIVWIEWVGAHPLTRVIRNGVACDGALIRDDRIEMPGAITLHLGERRSLRRGELGRMRGAVARLVAQLPGMADVHESRWLRTGEATSEGRAVAQGWVIDEEVRMR